MGEKDVTEKILEAYNEVFADIMNVFLFSGEQVVRAEDLEDEQPTSGYKAGGKYHGQERDVAKRLMNGVVRIASMGIENQTGIDADMPLRVIGYDGAAYRAQLLAENADNPRYPAISIVLYYDHKRSWSGPVHLKERLEIPPAFEPFVSDYRMNVFSMADLTREDVARFRSDFRFVADYYVQLRENRRYVPPREDAEHLEAVVQLLAVMEDDQRYEEIYQRLRKEDPEKGGPRNMCEVLDQAINEGIQRGVEMERERTANALDQAINEGIEKGMQMERERTANALDQGLRAMLKFAVKSNASITEIAESATEFGITDEADLRRRAAEIGIQLPE